MDCLIQVIPNTGLTVCKAERYATLLRLLMPPRKTAFEKKKNIEVQGEKASKQPFLLFSRCFYPMANLMF